MNHMLLENEMYMVMTAICDSNIPINFKGAMVLHAFLYESGYDEDAVRPTKDIDANWLSENPPSMDEIRESLQRILDDNGIALTVVPFREYGQGRSAGFDFLEIESKQPVFSMDMDINRLEAGVRIYEIGKFRFRGVIIEQILADKISVVSTDKVFRRVKDVIDLYYLSQSFELNADKVRKVMNETGRRLSTFDGFLNRKGDLGHAYSKFRFAGDVKPPDFDEMYDAVKAYLHNFIES